MVYTLTIPENALRFATIFALTPVKEIQGYPFSGGYQAAVQIEPEGIYFDTPATISL